MSAGMLLVMFIFHDLVGFFFLLLFLFPQKERLILLLPFCWLAALSTYYEELQFKLFMLSIVWNNKWLYWQLMGSFASFWLRPYRIWFSDLFDFVMRARCFVGVCECVCSMHVHVTCEGSAMTGDLLHCWCWMSDGLGEWVLLYNVSRLNERESSHQIIAQPHSVTHTHTYTLLLLYLFINQAYISKSSLH